MGLLMLLVGLINQTYGQTPCPLNGVGGLPISTKPVPYTGPPQDYKTNTWDWKQINFPIYKSGYPDFRPTGNLFDLRNPYYNLGNLYLFYAYNENSDFYSEDGWELIKRDFGYLYGDNNIPNNYISNVTQNKSVAYFILYNKYSNILRVLATLPTQNGISDFINVNLEFADLTKLSGLFNNYGRLAQATDQKTINKTMTTAARFPADKSLLFFADFLMAYDPCTCQFNSGLTVTFTTIQRMKVDISGRLLATGIPISDIVDGKGSFYGDDNPEKFLTSVYRDGFNPDAGIQTYKRIDDLKTDYINAYQNPSDKNLLDKFFKAVKFGASVAKIFYSPTEAAEVVSNIDKVYKTAEALSSGADFFSSVFGEK